MPSRVSRAERYSVLREQLSVQLPAFLQGQRWFGGKARRILSTEIADIVPWRIKETEALVFIVRVEFAGADGESYVVPVVPRVEEGAHKQEAGLLTVTDGGETFVFADALRSDEFLDGLLDAIRRESVVAGESGELRGRQSRAFAKLCPEAVLWLKGKLLTGEQSNSSIVYGDRLILKFFRRTEEGVNPDLEMSAFLSERADYRNVPGVAGFLEYRSGDGKRGTQGILQEFVPNQGDAWRFTQKSVTKFYEEVESIALDEACGDQIHMQTKEAIGAYLGSVKLLAQRTAELHLALASEANDAVFAPEPFTMEFQKELEGSLLRMSGSIVQLLREKISDLPTAWQVKARAISNQERGIAKRFREILGEKIEAARIRIHGDFHLGQVLYTGSDFVIIDFEGEPARPLIERRVKRSPLQDVAGMLRSFQYAAFAPLADSGGGSTKRFERLRPFAESWNVVVAEAFLGEYFKTSGAASYLPQNPRQRAKLLELHLLEKAIYELGYELNNRPSWIGLPLEGISKLLDSSGEST